MARKKRYVFYSVQPQHRVLRFFRRLGILLLAILLLAGAANFVISRQVQVETGRITVQTLPDAIENWSILVVSDLHGQHLGTRMAAVRSALGNRAYSCAVFLGDMTGPGGDTSAMEELLELIPGDVPKLLVPGDEDPPLLASAAHGSLSVWNDWAERLQSLGVTLVDEPTPVTRGKSTLWFVPEYIYSLNLDNMESAYQAQRDSLSGEDVILTPDQAAQLRLAEWQLEKIARIRDVKKNFSTDNVLITLSHTPVSADYLGTMMEWTAKDNGFSLRHTDLILSGHYCAGQWRLPGLGPIHVPEKGWFPGDAGITDLQYLAGIPQYISPGLGSSGFYGWRKGRLFNSPVVSVIYLTARMT